MASSRTRSQTRRLSAANADNASPVATTKCQHCQKMISTYEFLEHVAACKKRAKKQKAGSKVLDATNDDSRGDSDDEELFKDSSVAQDATEDEDLADGDEGDWNDEGDAEFGNGGADSDSDSVDSGEFVQEVDKKRLGARQILENPETQERYIFYDGKPAQGNTKSLQYGHSFPSMMPIVVLRPHTMVMFESKLTNAERFDKDVRVHKYLEKHDFKQLPKLLYYSKSGQVAVYESWDGTLCEYCEKVGPFAGETALALVLKVAELLEKLHNGQRLVHHDFLTINILERWNSEKQELELGLIDFESVTRLNVAADALGDLNGFATTIVDVLGFREIFPAFGASVSALLKSKLVPDEMKARIRSCNVQPILKVMEKAYVGKSTLTEIINDLRSLNGFSANEDVALEQTWFKLEERKKANLLKEAEERREKKKAKESKKIAIALEADSPEDARRKRIDKRLDDAFYAPQSAPDRAETFDSSSKRGTKNKSRGVMDFLDGLSDQNACTAPRVSRPTITSPVLPAAQDNSFSAGLVAGCSGLFGTKAPASPAKIKSTKSTASPSIKELEEKQKQVFPVASGKAKGRKDKDKPGRAT